MPSSTARHLSTADEVLDAARWRLRDWAPEEVDAGVEQVAVLLESGDALSSEQPDVSDVLQALGDDRDDWAALCALLVLIANANDDFALLFRAGIYLMQWRRQAGNARRPRCYDALDSLIAAYVQEAPDIEPKRLWDDLAASVDDDHPVLVGFDEQAGLEYLPERMAPSKFIPYGAFRQRVRRMRRRLGGAPPLVIFEPPIPVVAPRLSSLDVAYLRA
jgi:hypothetical protein